MEEALVGDIDIVIIKSKDIMTIKLLIGETRDMMRFNEETGRDRRW
jgi:hypothetical protein